MPQKRLKLSTSADVLTIFTSCGCARWTPLFVMNVAEIDMSLPSIRSIARFPWTAYGYSKSLETCKVNGSTGPKPVKADGSKCIRPNWYRELEATPGVIEDPQIAGFDP